MLDDETLPTRLSAAQNEFAHTHSANPALRFQSQSGSVFMYRSDERRTHRWLVDKFGRTVESASFLR